MTARTPIEISSGDESDTFIPPLRMRNLRPTPRPPIHIDLTDPDPQKRALNRGVFSNFLTYSVPIHLIPADVRNFWFNEGNARLAKAKKDKVPVRHMWYGEDCLPTWASLAWDPEQEELHIYMQRRLKEYDIAQGVGNLIQKDLILKANNRIREACRLGVTVDALFIDVDGLPTWNDAAEQLALAINPGFSNRCNRRRPFGPLEPFSNALSPESMYASEDDDEIRYSTVFYNPQPEIEEAEDVTPKVKPTAQHLTEDDDSFEILSASEESFDDCNVQLENYDDVIELNNFVGAAPTYSDGNEPTSNILHDAEMIDETGRSHKVDLSVYITEECEEVMDLPEVELAVDKESFEHYHNADEAIDVEFSGTQVRFSESATSRGRVVIPKSATVEDCEDKGDDYFSLTAKNNISTNKVSQQVKGRGRRHQHQRQHKRQTLSPVSEEETDN